MNTVHKNILILCSGYLNSTSANGVCAKNLANEMIRQGHSVWVIAVTEEPLLVPEVVDKVTVYGIPKIDQVKRFKKLQASPGLLNRIKYKAYRAFLAVFSFFSYPNSYSKTRLNQVIELSKRIIEREHIDVVLGTSFPYNSIEASIQLKKTYGSKLKVFTYHFDLLFYPNNTNKLICWFKRGRVLRAFANEAKSIDRIYLPESCKEDKLPCNVSFIGLPVCVLPDIQILPDFKFDSNYTNLVYIGSLDATNRNPIEVLQIISSIKDAFVKPPIVHIWGKITDAKVKKYIESSTIAKYYGMVGNQYISYLFSNADYLINIGNKTLYNLLPSKIFQFFASGKPVVNFVQDSRDVSIPYFRRYGRSILINTLDQIENDKIAENIQTLLSEKNGDSSNFEEFTPKYIVKLIID